MKDDTKGKIIDIIETSKEKADKIIDGAEDKFEGFINTADDKTEKFINDSINKSKVFINKSSAYLNDKKEKIEIIIKKAKEDETFKENLKKEPTKTVEELFGVDLPDEELK